VAELTTARYERLRDIWWGGSTSDRGKERQSLLNYFGKHIFTLLRRGDPSGWTFVDGVAIDDELKDVDIEKIREVIDQQSRTKWTLIASRDRLYQFMALSDERTQREMRDKALSLVPMDSGLSEDYLFVASAGTLSSTVFGNSSGNEVRLKRYDQ
jgi:hypothetical protein